MSPITGDTFELRDQLKALGCRWDAAARCWVAPDEGIRAQAQVMADAEPLRKWRFFADNLPWVQGSLSKATHDSAIRGCTLGVPEDVVASDAAARIAAAGSAVKPAKISRDVKRGYDYARQHAEVNGGARPSPRAGLQDWERSQKPVEKPVFAETKLAQFAGGWARTIDTAWLADRSPIDPTTATHHDFLRALYMEDERVVIQDVFASQGQWLWSHEKGFEPSRIDYQAWDESDPLHESAPPLKAGPAFTGSGPRGIWYLCNPVSGEWFQTGEEDGRGRPKWSRRSQPSVTSWRYFALESDDADPKEWVAAFAQLPLRISAIYTSGGSSVHFLVRVDAGSKAQFDEWRELAKRTMIPLGADPGCMSAVRLTRLPDCWREGKDDKLTGDYVKFEKPKAQKLLFLDPAATDEPLVARPVVRDTFGPWERFTEAVIAGDPEEIDADELERLRVGLAKFSGERAQRCRALLRRWL